MNLWQTVVLGVVQGITEFLPISSSGHLAIFQSLFGLKLPLFFDVFLHFGTLLAVLVVLHKKIRSIITSLREYQRLLYDLLIASSITAILGLWLKTKIETSFASEKIIGVFFIINGGILFLTHPRFRFEIFGRLKASSLRAAVVGLAQSLALFPGVSRSGATITSAFKLGYTPEQAFEFSFLLYIPAVLGALVLGVVDSSVSINSDLFYMSIFGMMASFAVGIVALRLLKKVLISRKLYYFSAYCIALGLLLIFS